MPDNTSIPTSPYRPLTEAEIEEIKKTSLQVLEETGFAVHHKEARELFKQAGASLGEDHVMKISPEKVETIISSAPSRLTLYGREDQFNVTLGEGKPYFATGGTALNILDYNAQDIRPARLEDLIDVIRITEVLENIHVMLLPTYPTEVDVTEVDINRFFAGLCYTRKHIMGGIYTSQGIQQVIRMAEEVAGSAEALRNRPFISMIACGISPLILDAKYGEYMIQIARENIPLAVPVEPLAGATSPITLAGTLVIQNCDSLINVMLTQLANPGAPVIYGSVASVVNMHDGCYLGGPVESALINAATAQLARSYRLPYYSTAGISDSKTLDTQCGYEPAISNLLLALAGGELIHDSAGLMEFANTVSKEKLVLDNEILGMALRAAKGIEVNPRTLAMDVIKQVGPAGNFISHRHTRRYTKKEHYLPKLTDRQKRENWKSTGAQTITRRAHEKVREILESSPEMFLRQETITKLLDTYPIYAGKYKERS